VEPSAEDIVRMAEAFGQMKDSALIAAGAICFFVLAGFLGWVFVRHLDKKQLVLAASTESKGKDERARLYRASMAQITKQLAESAEKCDEANRQSEIRIIQAIHEHATNEYSMNERIGEALAKQSSLLQNMLDMSKSIIRTDESLRIVEDAFLNVILPEFIRIGEQSLIKNDYKNRSDLVERKARQALSGVVYKTSQSLTERYSLSVKVPVFFPPRLPEGIPLLVDRAWDIIQRVHEQRLHTSKDSPGSDLIPELYEQLAVDMRDLCLQCFNTGAERASDLYREDETAHSRIFQRTPSEPGIST